MAKIEKKGDNWIVTPTNPEGGQATVHIKDENGRLVAVWIVDIAPQPEQDVENQEVNRKVNDRATVEISRGSFEFNRLEVVEGSEYLTEGADGSDFGDKDNLKLKFKPVPEGETRTVKVVEKAKIKVDQRDENGDLLLDLSLIHI